ncbi:MAG: hypothetical protein ACXITR_11945 [Cyanobacterium sp.]
MSKNTNNNAQNVVIALIAVTGFSVVHQSGLAGQLFQVLDQSLVQSAMAQNREITPSRQLNNFKVEEIKVNRIRIEGNQAYQMTESGRFTPLPDGYYKFPSGEILTLEKGQIINQRSAFDEGGSWREGNVWERGPDAGPFREAGWRDGNVWERDTSGDDEMRRQLENRSVPGVRETFDRVQPINNGLPTRTPTPVNPINPINPGNPGNPSFPPQRNIQPGTNGRPLNNTTIPNLRN